MTDASVVFGNPKYLVLHQFGFVGLVDIMGDDAAVVQAARVSYGKETRHISDDRNLIRYLFRHQHMTPFEMGEGKYHVKLPIFVERQWIRHRTASTNEYSGRYSEMSDEFYLPDTDHMAPQSTTNKQGRSESADIADADKLFYAGVMHGLHKQAYADYQTLLEKGNPDKPGLARELARTILPVANYTEKYWKLNLRNLFGFLKLRLDSHAQSEIRDYANAVYHLIKPHFPLCCEAFEDYSLNAVMFSRMEMDALRHLFDVFKELGVNPDGETLEKKYGLSKREVNEFRAKLGFTDQ